MNETYYTAESVDYDEKTVCVDYIISLATVASLFVVSEILPFLKSKKSNGLIDMLICCFESSDCCLQRSISCLKGEHPSQQEQKQSQDQETTQALKTENTQTQNVNINISKKNSVKNMVNDIEKEVSTGTIDDLP